MNALETRLWNLGTAAVLGLGSAGCGSELALTSDESSDEGESPTDGDDDYNVDGYNDDGYGYDPPSYDCYDYGNCQECYDDDDCWEREDCDPLFGHCVGPTPLTPCIALPEFSGLPEFSELPLPGALPEDRSIVSLSFVDLDPDTPGEALVVGAQDGNVLLRFGLEPAVLPDSAAANDAATADFDQDGQTDLALVHDEGLTLYFGPLANPMAASVPSVNRATAVEIYQSAGSAPGLVIRTAANTALFATGLQERTPALQPLAVGAFPISGIAGFDDGAGSRGFLLNASVGERTRLYFDLDDYTELGDVPGRDDVRTLLTGQLGFGPESDPLWVTRHEDWTRLAVAREGAEDRDLSVESTYLYLDTGDLDGDGLDDLMALGDEGSVVIPGHEVAGLLCEARTETFAGSRHLALGDYDGDGRAEVITTTADGALVRFDVSWGR